MTRYEYIIGLSIGQIAEKLISLNIIDDFCKGECDGSDEERGGLNESPTEKK